MRDEEVHVTGALLVLGLVVVLIAFDRAMLAAERRGWVRWRRCPPSRSSASTALLEVMALYEPAHRHVVGERLATDAEEAGDDDPLEPRAPRTARTPRAPLAPHEPRSRPGPSRR